VSEPCVNCRTLLSALKGADAEIARLRAEASAPRWWCTGCDRHNVGGDACAGCGSAKPVQPKRDA
jgi:hypothetical protein